ncbi:NAD(P)-binding protein [Imleria badia]|nr:NAD(P)-binding protein [Imleria badia]
MASTKTQIFITGATGYIGGVVLERLLEHRTAPDSEITALVRDPAKVAQFASIGVKTVLGSLEDGALLERLASKSDVVFACADADHVGACKAILRGLKKRHEVTGAVPILVHTASVLTDDAKGMYAYDTIWDDMNPDQLETLPDTQPHRNVDLLVLAADKQGYARTHIVLPSNIYDIATGPLVDLGIQNPRSRQIPRLVGASIARERAGMVGLGLNKWPNVHIDDIGDLYMVLYDAIRDGRAGHGREGLYFGESGEHALRAISERIGEALVELGVSPPDARTPTSFDEADYARPGYEQLLSLGTNSRCKANRAGALGWQPRYTTEDMLESVRGEVVWQLTHVAGV